MSKELTQQRLKEVVEYNEETGVFTWRRRKVTDTCDLRLTNTWNTRWAGRPAGTKHHSGYVFISIDGEDYAAHRLVWLYVHGRWPEKDIDHKNRVRSDNRLNNLRDADDFDNSQNSSANTSGHVGVYWNSNRKKWHAQIKVKGVNTYLGLFDKFEDAVKVRQQAELKHFGKLSKDFRHVG